MKGLISGLLRIGISEGKEHLWAGTVASLILVSNPAIKFTVYEYLKRIFLPTDQSQLSPLKAFLIGALGSAIATLITYPVQVVQTKSRHGGTGYSGLYDFLTLSYPCSGKTLLPRGGHHGSPFVFSSLWLPKAQN